nr:MAG: RNA-dependent RNA polymerase [Zhejiang farmland noda-like virus]
MSLSILKGSACLVAAPARGICALSRLAWRHPKPMLALVATSVALADFIRWYIKFYHKVFYRYEFVPPTYQGHKFVRFLCTCARFVAADYRYRLWTCFGLFPPHVMEYSRKLEKSIERKPDLRPRFVPAGDAVEIFSCNSVHSHPRSAEFRSSANAYLIDAVRRAGYNPYVVSASRRDDEKGSRYFYCVKDFGITYKADPIQDNSALVFTDVDYYACMPDWMCLWKPICMYTLVPTQLNYSNEEFSFHFSGNTVAYHVSGGGKYKHELWDYRGDTVTAIDAEGNLLIFDIEQRRIKGDPQHRLIWLLPRARITDLLWVVGTEYGLDWAQNLLSRKVVLANNIKTLWEPIDDSLSIGLESSNYSVNINGKLFESIRTRLRYKDSAPYVSDVERMLKEAGHPEHTKDAPILFRCVTEDVLVRPNVVKTGTFPVMYHAIPRNRGLATEDPKPPGQVFGSPLVSQPALFAAKGHNADLACIEGRIEAVRNTKKFPVEYKRYATEFVNLLVPDSIVGTGVPISIGEVRELQAKKAQRGRFDRVAPIMSIEAKNEIKSFIKTETYGASKPPRNISTMSPEITIQSSAYSLPMAEHLKKLDWYCPGKRPSSIVDRLRVVLQMDVDENIEEGDYTCLDGSQSADYSNLLLLPMYMRYFADEHRNGFRRLYKEIYVNKAKTATGVGYKPDMSVRSGSSITTQAGTLDNAFNVYCALRNMGYNPEDAWGRIGAIFGDDSVNANHRGIFREHVEKVAKQLGMIYKSNLRSRGEPILFLGRYFVDPLTTNDSFADPLRTIGKLHASGNKSVTPEQAATNKAVGYLTTDAKTPIIGTWAARVIKITGLKFKNGTGEEQYRCSNAWPQRDATTIAEAMAKVLEITLDELKKKDEDIKKADGLDDFPVIFDTCYKHTQPAVVGGDVVCTDLHQPIQHNERQPGTSHQSVQQADRPVGGRPSTGVNRPGRNAGPGTQTAQSRRNRRARTATKLPREDRCSKGGAHRNDTTGSNAS